MGRRKPFDGDQTCAGCATSPASSRWEAGAAADPSIGWGVLTTGSATWQATLRGGWLMEIETVSQDWQRGNTRPVYVTPRKRCSACTWSML